MLCHPTIIQCVYQVCISDIGMSKILYFKSCLEVPSPARFTLTANATLVSFAAGVTVLHSRIGFPVANQFSSFVR